jgi:CRISPR-associated protein Cas2
MRIIVLFDLPVATKKDRKEYADFRKFLIKDGYDMIQFSVYARITLNHDDSKKHIDRLKNITEKQYISMQILLGETVATENFLKPREIMEL